MITLFTEYLSSKSINFNPSYIYILTVFIDLFVMDCIKK